jgi:hypothetical protein
MVCYKPVNKSNIFIYLKLPRINWLIWGLCLLVSVLTPLWRDFLTAPALIAFTTMPVWLREEFF